MSNLFSEMANDAVNAPTPEALSRIAALAELQIQYEAELTRLNSEVEDTTKKLRQVQELDLPETMRECGVSEFKLTSGRKISVKKVYRGSISEERSNECFGWLKDNGHDDIIKNEVKMAFGRGDEEKAAFVVNKLIELGYTPAQKKSVHPQTLFAFIKEQIESGADFPQELFGTFIGYKASIK
jgi:hypothetical protein